MTAEILFIETDIPDGQTLREWRRVQPVRGPRHPVRRLVRRALRSV